MEVVGRTALRDEMISGMGGVARRGGMRRGAAYFPDVS